MTLFTPWTDQARDLVISLDPEAPAAAGTGASKYLPIQFALDSDHLPEEAREDLEFIVEALTVSEPGEDSFVVEGHADAGESANSDDGLPPRWAISAYGWR